MQPTDDHLVLAKAATGDRSAIEELVRRHAPLVLAACRRQLRGIDADDAAQAVFLVLWRRAERAASAPSLPGWLVVTAHQVCANARRSAARRHHAERSAGGPTLSEPLIGEARALLDQALAALPSAERAAVVQRHLLGEDPATVASALGCAEGTVHSRTSRGLERLRVWFARRGIACSTAALAVLCANECAAAESILSSEAAACATASPAANSLATATTTTSITSGSVIMGISILACTAALVAWGALASAAEPFAKVYGLDDLTGNGGIIVQTERSTPGKLSVPPEPPPVVDPSAVAAIAAGCDLEQLTSTVLRVAGAGSLGGFIDAGTSDRELNRLGIPAGGENLAMARRNMANYMDVVFPGFDMQRMLLVTTSGDGHRRIDSLLRHARSRPLNSDPKLLEAAEALDAAALAAVGADWMAANGPCGDGWPVGWKPRALTDQTTQLRTVGPAAHRFAVIWLVEGLHLDRPVAIATDGRCSLAATRSTVRWYPDLRPAIIALGLRQRIDSHMISVPLHRDHWTDAAAVAMPGPERLRLQADLAEMVNGIRTQPDADRTGF